MLTNVLNNNTIEFKVGEVVYFAKEISSTQCIIQKTYVAKKVITESEKGIETVFLFAEHPYANGPSQHNIEFKDYQYVYTEETLDLLIDKLRNIKVSNF